MTRHIEKTSLNTYFQHMNLWPSMNFFGWFEYSCTFCSLFDVKSEGPRKKKAEGKLLRWFYGDSGDNEKWSMPLPASSFCYCWTTIDSGIAPPLKGTYCVCVFRTCLLFPGLFAISHDLIYEEAASCVTSIWPQAIFWCFEVWSLSQRWALQSANVSSQ